MADVIQVSNPFQSIMERLQAEQAQQHQQQSRDDENWLQAHAPILQKLDRDQQSQYLSALAQSDPARFRRVFTMDPANVHIDDSPEEKYKTALANEQTAVVTGRKADGFNPIYRGNLITGSKTDGRVQGLQAEQALNGLPAAQDAADIEFGRKQTANQQVATAETNRDNLAREGFEDRKVTAEERKVGPWVAAEQARAGNLRAETGEHQARTRQINAGYGEGGAVPEDVVDRFANLGGSLSELPPRSQQRSDVANAVFQKYGVRAAESPADLQFLTQASNKADLVQGRINKLKELAPKVVDDMQSRLAVAALINDKDHGAGALVQSMVRRGVSPDTLEYVNTLRHLREDLFSLRGFLGNSPVRSDRQVGIFLGQAPSASAGSSDDVLSQLTQLEPTIAAVRRGRAPVAPYPPNKAAQQGGPRVMSDDELLKRYAKQ